MPGLPFTLRQLDVFADLCSTRSFGRTAQRLGISQASVSNQVKALEQQLGLALLLRIPGRRPTLTDDGSAFLEDLGAFHAAANVLAGYRRASSNLPDRLNLRIRAGQGLVDQFIRPKLGHFLAEHPDIALEFDAHPPSKRIADDVLDRRFDFGLFHLRADHPVSFPFRVVALLRGGIYGHRRFAEGRRLPLAPEQVAALPFILPSEGSEQEEEVQIALRRTGISPRKVVCHTQYFDVIAKMLEQGLGVASFAEVILPLAMRETVVLLYPLHDWRLIWYRRDDGTDPRHALVETFLISSLLCDADYLTVEVFDTTYRPR